MPDVMPTSPPPELDGVLVRQATAGDLNYLYSTLLRDMRDADPSGLPDTLWFPPHRQYLDALLADRATTTLIASAADQPREILGYVIATPSELAWVHVRKGPLRERGIARLLLSKAGVTPSTPTRWTTRLGRQRLSNPYRSRELRRSTAAVESTAPRSGASTR